MLKFFSKEQSPTSFWNTLKDPIQLDEIDELSNQKPVLIFKHSTRCGISAAALRRFEQNYSDQAVFEAYFLDLISYRDISSEIANKYGVMHESPQAILIFNGQSIHDVSHNGIDFNEINQIAKVGL